MRMSYPWAHNVNIRYLSLATVMPPWIVKVKCHTFFAVSYNEKEIFNIRLTTARLTD